MDLAQRLNLLETVHDWQTLAEELERAIGAEADPAVRAQYHLRLGRLLDEKYLQGVRALKHYQDAYKLSPSLGEALSLARGIYWELGKANMVQRLLDLQLKAAEGPDAVPLLVELADVYCDAGDAERGTATYARALAASNGESEDARAGLEDMQVGPDSWNDRVGELVALAQEAEGAVSTLR